MHGTPPGEIRGTPCPRGANCEHTDGVVLVPERLVAKPGYANATIARAEHVKITVHGVEIVGSLRRPNGEGVKHMQQKQAIPHHRKIMMPSSSDHLCTAASGFL